MKLFIVTCLKEDQEEVTSIFKKAGINAFSAAAVAGFKNGQAPLLMEAWFAAGDEVVDSVMLFSFTAAENAATGIALIDHHNQQTTTAFPIRAFIVPVEQSNC